MTKTRLESEFALAVLLWMKRDLTMTDVEVGNGLDVDSRTMKDWLDKKGPPRADDLERLRQLALLKRLMDSAFGTPEGGKAWLLRPLPAFSGRKPISMLAAGNIDSVLGILASHESGAHL
jgi:uncharacterized protein (DUF2384 family)